MITILCRYCCNQACCGASLHCPVQLHFQVHFRSKCLLLRVQYITLKLCPKLQYGTVLLPGVLYNLHISVPSKCNAGSWSSNGYNCPSGCTNCSAGSLEHTAEPPQPLPVQHALLDHTTDQKGHCLHTMLLWVLLLLDISLVLYCLNTL